MDEMNIRSELLRGAVAKIIEKVISQKLGFRPELQFVDPIQMSFDGERAKVHVNLDVEMNKADLEALITKVI